MAWKNARVWDGTTPKLTWRPPPLESPTTVAILANQTMNLDDNLDYILTLPADAPLQSDNGIRVDGGRNVQLIGGTVDVTDGGRGAYFLNQKQSVYIEGVHFTTSFGPYFDEGMQFSLPDPDTAVYVQNVKVDPVFGTVAGNHADVLQTFAGPAYLRVDRLDGNTNYQGLFINQRDLAPDYQAYEVSLKNLGITGRDDGDGATYLLWRATTTDGVWHTENVQLAGDNVRPWDHANLHYGNGVKYPLTTADTMTINPGFGYVSPGYR